MYNLVKRKIRKICVSNLLKSEKEFYFDNNNRLKYLFLNNKKSDELLVIFSGFPEKGKKPGYSYLTKFNDVKINKLFILDDFGSDKRGSYYLGENRDFFIETAVFELIEDIRKSRKINKSNVITAGSSKGGFASLFFAFKYEYGVCISGAPSYLLGDYLANPGHRHIMKYISGGIEAGDISFLNNILSKIIENNSNPPKTFIHVSKNEPHYEEGVLPLVSKLNNLGYEYCLNLGEYYSHIEVGKYFPAFLKDSITEFREDKH